MFPITIFHYQLYSDSKVLNNTFVITRQYINKNKNSLLKSLIFLQGHVYVWDLSVFTENKNIRAEKWLTLFWVSVFISILLKKIFQ